MADTVTVPVLVGDNEELYSIVVSTEEYQQIIKGDNKLLEELIYRENEKRSAAMVQQITIPNTNQNTNTNTNQKLDHTLGSSQSVILSENDADENSNGEKESFNWNEKATMLFLELYREKEQEFTAGIKRHNKLWAEIASELRNSNYNVSATQVQNKLSGLKRTYKKIKDSNAMSGNQNSCWTYYSVMDSLFNTKSWVCPSTTASSDGPTAPSTSSSSISCSSSPSTMDSSECQAISSCTSKSKKRKVEVILESFISDLKTTRNDMKEERRKERLEKEQKKEQKWEIYRKEKREMHKETTEIQQSLVNLLGKLIEKKHE